jgi:hypothetical protein
MNDYWTFPERNAEAYDPDEYEARCEHCGAVGAQPCTPECPTQQDDEGYGE